MVKYKSFCFASPALKLMFDFGGSLLKYSCSMIGIARSLHDLTMPLLFLVFSTTGNHIYAEDEVKRATKLVPRLHVSTMYLKVRMHNIIQS